MWSIWTLWTLGDPQRVITRLPCPEHLLGQSVNITPLTIPWSFEIQENWFGLRVCFNLGAVQRQHFAPNLRQKHEMILHAGIESWGYSLGGYDMDI